MHTKPNQHVVFAMLPLVENVPHPRPLAPALLRKGGLPQPAAVYQGHSGGASVSVAWVGEGADGVAMGVYGPQFEKADRCSGGSARRERNKGDHYGEMRNWGGLGVEKTSYGSPVNRWRAVRPRERW